MSRGRFIVTATVCLVKCCQSVSSLLLYCIVSYCNLHWLVSVPSYAVLVETVLIIITLKWRHVSRVQSGPEAQCDVIHVVDVTVTQATQDWRHGGGSFRALPDQLQRRAGPLSSCRSPLLIPTPVPHLPSCCWQGTSHLCLPVLNWCVFALHFMPDFYFIYFMIEIS